jgi:prepilin-type N-terminal cleavage/methylation domain-containing protein
MTPLLTTQQGFTLMEALLSLTLVSIVAVPLLMGLTGTASSVGIREEQTALANAARGKMEEILAMGFANIPLSAPPGTPNALSDQVTIRGKSVSRNVIVDLADGDLPPDGLVDAGFKRILIAVGGFELHSYIAAGS